MKHRCLILNQLEQGDLSKKPIFSGFASSIVFDIQIVKIRKAGLRIDTFTIAKIPGSNREGRISLTFPQEVKKIAQFLFVADGQVSGKTYSKYSDRRLFSCKVM